MRKCKEVGLKRTILINMLVDSSFDVLQGQMELGKHQISEGRIRKQEWVVLSSKSPILACDKRKMRNKRSTLSSVTQGCTMTHFYIIWLDCIANRVEQYSILKVSDKVLDDFNTTAHAYGHEWSYQQYLVRKPVTSSTKHATKKRPGTLLCTKTTYTFAESLQQCDREKNW